MYWRSGLLCAFILLLISCQTAPTGPSVTVLPGPGKPLEVFQADDAACREWAHQHMGSRSGAGIGSIGIGGGVGGFSGGSSSFGGGGVVIGGGDGGEPSSYELQSRYDSAYEQCMYARGNQIPGAPPPSYRPPPSAGTGEQQVPSPQSGPYAPQSTAP